MLDRRSWERFTHGLDIGRSIRVDHDCGAGRTLKVSHKEAGFDAHCWRCGEGGFIPHQVSLAERIERLRKVRQAALTATASPALPSPREYDPQLWPDYASVWLYKAGMSNDDIVGLRFYYCSNLDRVVMPLYEGDTPVYWQARGFDKGLPKYINPPVDRTRLLFKAGTGSVLVLTEDILSAYKVGKVTEAWSLMGTSISDFALNLVARSGKPVRIMLDPDAGGESGRRKAQRKLQMMGLDVEIIVPRKDPKLLTLAEIRTILNMENACHLN